MKFITLLTKEKGKTARNDREHDDSDIFRAFAMYIKNTAILVPFLLANLFKQMFKYISFVKSYKYLNKSRSIKTMVLTFLKVLCICARSR